MIVKRITAKVVRGWLKRRPKEAHKGSNGRVLIIAGSRGMVGAGILAAGAAVRSGAGLVRLATVKSQQVVAAKRAPLEVTTQALPEDENGKLANASLGVIRKTILSWRPSVVVFGPGLGETNAIRKNLQALLQMKGMALLLDADGLNALAHLRETSRPSAVVLLTPHAGECARLLKTSATRVNADRISSVKRAAKKHGGVCLLKGAGTLVSDGYRVWQNTTGNPAMASGGMGDVLSGMIAALWAQEPIKNKETAARAAAMGAYLHGRAGDLAVRQFPERTLLASDVVNTLPKAFQEIWRFS